MLCSQRQTQGNAGEYKRLPRAAHRIPKGGPDGSQKHDRDCSVGCDQRPMRQQIGLEGQQRERQKTGGLTKHVAAGEENQQTERERKYHHRHARAKEQLRPAVARFVSKQQVTSVKVRFILEHASLERRNTKIQRQQRQRRNHLGHGRMFWIQAEIAGPQAHKAGEEMIALIPRHRLAMHADRHRHEKHCQQQNHQSGGSSPGQVELHCSSVDNASNACLIIFKVSGRFCADTERKLPASTPAHSSMRR